MTDTRITAPALPGTLQWINTDAPLRLADLRGKIVLLNFWTAGCINCSHVLEDMQYLESKYRDNLVVISIHSPKFPRDKDVDSVVKAVNRYHIKHPVAHDAIKRVWTKYGIKAWPSFVFIDAEGYVIGSLRGEGRRRQLDALVKQYIEVAEQKDIVSLVHVPIRPNREPVNILSFPGQVCATMSHFYVSDSGHNRVLEVNHYGRVTRVFGSGGAGLLDGFGRNSAFNNPQGLLLINDFLYVADTGNHSIRRINVTSEEVLTIAGDGKIGRYKERYFSDPLNVQLNSPWDLSYHKGELYISMTGVHQIWKMDLTENLLQVFTGTGQEDLIDGRTDVAAFAQPSGMTAGDQCIYVIDAESSSVRKIRLPDGQVSTLLGKGLFVFGDENGGLSNALLQHPLSICHDANNALLYIADTYNSKIKLIDLKLNGITTLDAGEGLNEPSGISLSGNSLWIANTNEHEIRKIDLITREVEVIDINEPERDF